jgi:hypothetical protein
MKKTLKLIKTYGFREWLIYFSPRPLSYIGDAYNWLFPKHKLGWVDYLSIIFKPRQRWIKDHIEYNKWCDKVQLIPDFLFGCVVHLVEEEKWLESIDYEATDHHAKFAKELQECYDYIKVGRPKLNKDLDEAYKNIPDVVDYEERYGEVIRIEKELTDLDQKYSIWIVTNKGFMWT